MSSWIVSRNHIHFLVYALGKYELLEDTPEKTGQILWDTNIQGVQYRYGDESIDTLPGPIDETYIYDDQPYHAALDDATVVKACHCYHYQSCDDPAYEETVAYRWISMLEEAVAKGRKPREIPGYDDAPWSID